MLVLMTFMSVTEGSEKAILISAKELERITYIQYPIAFPVGITQDGSAPDPVLALYDSSSEVNAIHPVFTKKLGLVVQITNIGAQKIDSTTLETYEMVVAAFSVIDQANRIRFFEEIFIVANISPDVIFEYLFLS